MRPIDLIVIKKLADVINVMPVIAKADDLTLEERAMFKQQIRTELTFNEIRLYPFDESDQDEEERELNERIRDLIPLAVVGSERSVVVDGKTVIGRKSRYGVVQVENENHCEFVYLRNFLTRYVSRKQCSCDARADYPLVQDPFARFDRDDGPDPLRVLPLQATDGTQGVKRPGCRGPLDPFCPILLFLWGYASYNLPSLCPLVGCAMHTHTCPPTCIYPRSILNPTLLWPTNS